VDKVPGMRPPRVGLGQVDVLERRAVLGALNVPGHQNCSKLLGVDAPVAKYAVGIGTDVDRGERSPFEARFVDDLCSMLVKGHIVSRLRVWVRP
jgi:hypothetical protein